MTFAFIAGLVAGAGAAWAAWAWRRRGAAAAEGEGPFAGRLGLGGFLKELTALHQAASAVATYPEDPSGGLGALASIVARALEADFCAFLLYDEERAELVTQPGAYGLKGGDALYRMPVTNQQSSSVRAFLTGESFMTGDAQNDPQVLARFAQLWRCRSLIVVPLTLEDRRLGVMRVGGFRPDAFKEEHLRLSELIAEEAVVLVEGILLTRRLSEANRKLSDINRMKDDFVSTVSHEFKTPLTAIKGFLTVLLDQEAGALTEQQRRFLTIALGATDRLTMLVSDLLDLSRLEAGVKMDFASVPLGDVAEECRRDHQRQAEERGIRLEVEMPARLLAVRGDARWLRQMLDNLVSNAVKFTPPGGRVRVTAANRGEMVLLGVEDDGVGIGPEDHGRIFEKFYRARSRDQTQPSGTGLGLAIAKFIVDKHEGRIWVESEPGKGSRFFVDLPTAKNGMAA